jgi:UDP-N-acetylmuramate--alanine ligase
MPVSSEPVPAAELGRVHLIGIGGVGMAGLARIMLGRGIEVSGSETQPTPMLDELRALGARVELGHATSHLDGVDTVVVSTAIRPDNLELVEAGRRGVRVLHRAAALASISDQARPVAVAGTHGKTTTTALLTVALRHAGADPSFYIGGQLSDSGVNGHTGGGDVFVFEADESDGSFLCYRPHAAIITNVEPDHLDFYGAAEEVEKAFVTFADHVATDGFLLVCVDDPGSRRVAEIAAGRGGAVVTYGEDPGADVRVCDVRPGPAGVAFDLLDEGRRFGPFTLAVPGAHNALNAAAAFAAGLRLGADPESLRAGLAGFSGTRRRFEYKGSAAGVRVYDDYGHHPTELRRTLAAARQRVGDGRLVVLFQPHRYSRTAAFGPQFGPALTEADVVVLTEVYASGEDPIAGVTGAAVAAGVPLPADRVVFEPSLAKLPEVLARLVRPGDLVLTMGAGDVTTVGPRLLAVLAERSDGSSVPPDQAADGATRPDG